MSDRGVAGGPIRTCIGCRRRRPQDQLVRLHVDDGDRLRLDRTGPGRGAWLCAATPAACLIEARDRRALDRAFRRRVDRGSVGALADELGGASVTGP
ncbi:MAG: YlxR family protein [Actinomycetota bacterium]